MTYPKMINLVALVDSEEDEKKLNDALLALNNVGYKVRKKEVVGKETTHVDPFEEWEEHYNGYKRPKFSGEFGDGD